MKFKDSVVKWTIFKMKPTPIFYDKLLFRFLKNKTHHRLLIVEMVASHVITTHAEIQAENGILASDSCAVCLFSLA